MHLICPLHGVAPTVVPAARSCLEEERKREREGEREICRYSRKCIMPTLCMGQLPPCCQQHRSFPPRKTRFVLQPDTTTKRITGVTRSTLRIRTFRFFFELSPWADTGAKTNNRRTAQLSTGGYGRSQNELCTSTGTNPRKDVAGAGPAKAPQTSVLPRMHPCRAYILPECTHFPSIHPARVYTLSIVTIRVRTLSVSSYTSILGDTGLWEGVP